MWSSYRHFQIIKPGKNLEGALKTLQSQDESLKGVVKALNTQASMLETPNQKLDRNGDLDGCRRKQEIAVFQRA